MLNQTFQPKELVKLASQSEIIKFDLGGTEQDILNSITKISYAVSQVDFSFTDIKCSVYKGKNVYETDNVNEHFAIKKLNAIIKRLYTVKYTNRNEILTQLIQVLNDGTNYKIIRADIKDFFETVPRKKLIDKLKSDSILGSLMINKLLDLDKYLAKQSCKGLPRGISLSPALSEIYLRRFDKSMRSNTNVYYYARYVDDIIIVCLDRLEDVENLLKENIKDLGLSFNHKYKVIPEVNVFNDFDYLGVNFKFGLNKIEYSLSKNKVNQIKTRIIKSLIDFSKNKNEKLLLNRIIFLTSNYNVYTKTESNNLKAGIYYNNQHINTYQALNDLNEFLRKSITAKRGSLARKTKLIPPSVASQCMKNCFFKGYIEKRMMDFNGVDISEIVRCWKYE
ncbi:MAG: antiviral reverse transcriptase Drt3a [Psychromonas sp.]